MNKTLLVQVNFEDPAHCRDFNFLMNQYACDPMGGGQPIPESVLENLASSLAKLPFVVSFICYLGNEAVGLITCFEGFSTFKCRPLLNIHDVVVLKQYRGQGISTMLLEAVEKVAKERGCCKITLEVLEGNISAQHAYKNFGFQGYELDPKMGKAMFWEKII